MSEGVARELGIASTTAVPESVAAVWPHWQELHPELRVVDPPNLRGWLRRVPAEESDLLLRVLARRASEAGDSDKVAALALAWCLLPGAQLVARRYYHVENIDNIVAVEVWFQVCEFPWLTKAKVAANIVGEVRYQVLRQLGVSNRPDPSERLNASAVRLADTLRWQALTEPTPAQELRDLLDHAVDHQVITFVDRALLLDAVETAWEFESSVSISGVLGGICSEDLTSRIAARMGCTSRTVRRRILAAVKALRASLPALLEEIREVA
ncbi:MAG: hypothetical protein LCH76_05165 [Actinobacteria bacterium]|nr:hypothetical protein [Actinomycetota bacterium]